MLLASGSWRAPLQVSVAKSLWDRQLCPSPTEQALQWKIREVAASPRGFFFYTGVYVLICNFVDGLCGSAKTYAALRYAHRLASLGQKVLIVQPSIFLIDQTCSDLTDLKPEVRFRAIHRATSDRVVADIIGHVKHAAPDGE